jgi:hypothetical protein
VRLPPLAPPHSLEITIEPRPAICRDWAALSLFDTLRLLGICSAEVAAAANVSAAAKDPSSARPPAGAG